MMLKFIASAAAVALAATTLQADPGGGGKGGGGDKGGGNGAQQSHGGDGGGNSKAKGGGDRAGPAQSAERPDRERGNGKAKGPDARVEAPRGNIERQARGSDLSDVQGDPGRVERGSNKASKADARSKFRDDVRSDEADRRAIRSDARESGREPFRWASLNRRDVVQGCPPGLAKKNNGCTPPGLAAKRNGSRTDDWREDFDRPDWWGLGGYQGRYSYHDGRLLQLGSNGSILGYLPLLGGALAPGNVWPSFYESVDVPDYYQNYYNLGSDDNYRYHDDAFYSVDPQTQAISAIAALLTGDDFAVGQPVPQGYDVYNVPYSYRDEYVDGPDAAYRYSDGYVYEVDPTTQLIRTAIELLT